MLVHGAKVIWDCYFCVGDLGADKVKEDAAQGARAAAIGEQHPAVRLCFERLGNKCLRSL